MIELSVRVRVETITEDGTQVVLRLFLLLDGEIVFSSEPQVLAVGDTAEIQLPLEVAFEEG